MANNEKRMLIVVDPQVDFISGTLPVPGAAQAMDALAAHIKQNDGRWAHKVVTSDWHPFSHCSFEPNGGPWPVHCVAHSPGAAIYFPLLQALETTQGTTEYLIKGNNPEREEYSILQNPASGMILAAELAQDLDDPFTDIDVCGLAGNVCVLNTLKDLIKLFGPTRLHVLEQFSPSLDDGSALHTLTSTL